MMTPTKTPIVRVGGYAIGPSQEIDGTCRIFDIVDKGPSDIITAGLKNNSMVLVYPGQELSPDEKTFWLETKGEETNSYNNDLSGYLEIYGTFEKADGEKNSVAGVIIASKVVPSSRYSER